MFVWGEGERGGVMEGGRAHLQKLHSEFTYYLKAMGHYIRAKFRNCY